MDRSIVSYETSKVDFQDCNDMEVPEVLSFRSRFPYSNESFLKV